MFDKLIDILKANPRRIVFTEGPDARILEAAARLKKDGFLTPVLVGNVEEVKAAAAKGGFDIEGLEILDPLTYDKIDEMVETMVALRKGKMTPEECRELLKKGNYFGTMLVKMCIRDRSSCSCSLGCCSRSRCCRNTLSTTATAWRWSCRCCRRMGRVTPVSYTHLDVYKRQV